MKISYIDKYSWRGDKNKEDSLINYVAHSLEDHNSDDSLDRMRGTSENIALAFGRLIDLLAEKKVLNAQEVVKIVGSEYKHEDVIIRE